MNSDPSIFWNSNHRIPLRSALVLQGGGARGLVLLGQVLALVRDKSYRAVAYAGSSAGALIALLIWSGMPPQMAITQLSERANHRGLLGAMFTTREQWLILGQYLRMWIAMIWNLFMLAPINAVKRWLGAREHPFWLPPVGCEGRAFEELIETLLRMGLASRGVDGPVLGRLIGKPQLSQRLTFSDVKKLSETVRELNAIESPTNQRFQALIAADPQLAALSREEVIEFYPGNMAPKPKNNIIFCLFGREIEDPYFPPLFVTATSLKSGEEVFFNNIEKRFLDVAISAAVRASAGHPMAFAPKEIVVDGEPQKYTDGGMVINYPTIAIDRLLRDLLQSPADGEQTAISRTEHSDIRFSSFVTLGLAWTDGPRGSTSVSKLLLGAAHRRLEDIIARSSSRLIHVQQEMPAEFPDVVDFHLLSPERIESLVQHGRQFVQKNMMRNIDGFRIDEQTRADIATSLKGVVKDLKKTIGYHESDFCRLHLFVEQPNRPSFLEKLCLVCLDRPAKSFMDYDTGVRRAGAGLVNLARYTRAPVVSRLDLLRRARDARPHRTVLGLRAQDVSHIEPGLNLGVTVPIFDPRTIRFLRRPRQWKLPDQEGIEHSKLVHVGDTRLNGTVFGVLALDLSVAEYGTRDLGELITDAAVRSLVAQMERTSYEMGCHIAHCLEGRIREFNSAFTPPPQGAVASQQQPATSSPYSAPREVP